MTCCEDPNVSTPPPPPPPLGDKCARAEWVCNCVPPPAVWDLVIYECVENEECTGQIACTEEQSVIEQFNGCTVLGPLAPDPVPGDFFYPPCDPECCPDATTTTTPPPTTTTTTPPPTTTTTTPPPTTTTPPLLHQCWYRWEIEWDCDTEQWLNAYTLAPYTTSDPPADFACSPTPLDLGWHNPGSLDACRLQRYVTNAEVCSLDGDCDIDDAPAAPDAPAPEAPEGCCTTTTTTPPPTTTTPPPTTTTPPPACVDSGAQPSCVVNGTFSIPYSGKGGVGIFRWTINLGNVYLVEAECDPVLGSGWYTVTYSMTCISGVSSGSASAFLPLVGGNLTGSVSITADAPNICGLPPGNIVFG